MSLWSRVLGRLSDRRADRSTGRPGVEEVHSGRPEDTGGKPNADAPDTNSTTGTTPNDTFVGRAAGADDPGYLETGAEKRAGDEGGAGQGAAR
jgi:hypothetical protein